MVGCEAGKICPIVSSPSALGTESYFFPHELFMNMLTLCPRNSYFRVVVVVAGICVSTQLLLTMAFSQDGSFLEFLVPV